VSASLPTALPGELEPAAERELRLRVELSAFEPGVRALRDAGGRFVTLCLAEQPEPSLLAVVALRGQLVALRAPLDGEPAVYPALGAFWPAARWAERELAERSAVVPLGLPDAPPLTQPDADRRERRVTGVDVFALPYGPVRSGIFEAIQFLIETGGEDVPSVQVRPFFKHRGLEARMRGMSLEAGAAVAERVAGIASVAYATAYAQAVERALGVEPPPRAQRWRAVYAELERIANHLDVIAKEAETTALFVGQARFQVLKENVLRLQAAFTGSRFARGIIVPGGVREDGHVDLDALLRALDAFERDLRRDRRLFLSTASMTDRLVGTGQLDRAVIEEHGAVGPLARGSGVGTDARLERPYGDYRRLGLEPVTQEGGDAMARIEVRFGEIAESARILRQAVDQLRRRDGALRTALPSTTGAALGWAEAPQGELVLWVEVQDGVVGHVHVADPSLRNWALFSHAFPKDVLTDFAFIEHSFGLTTAGSDR
jgi:Ni,Fe-hydrogenase III large subunit/Ni,Fe-hydrogenase III component G